MSRSTRAAGILGGLLGGVVAYWLSSAPLLAANAGVCWAGGCALLFREREAWSGDSDGASLADGLPAVLFVAVSFGIVNAGVELPDSLRWALVVLVFGAVFFAVGIGMVLGRRSVERSEEAAESSASAD
ncbi:hypothetical protein [Halogeometricum sp. CBA1124]|uniref:hypothetical protein n=1 Tax=Halogeometricum sp. CBA1124 TaxID=2668071 RepID=UPI001429E705|nr:hypothetical protein [Halogeometricum sp. CBA1124]MUV58475.1 hypothetical protein [Halogeometricum sp. CBA1124]